MAKKRINSAFIRSLMERITTLHGTSHFNIKTGRSLKIWMLLMIFNILLTIGFIFVIKAKFDDSKIVTQINANCKVSQAPFPAVSVCNFNQISLKESQNIVRILKYYKVNESEMINFFNGLSTLRSFDQNSINLKNFTNIMSILKHHYFTMDTVMEEVHQKCENLALYCTFNRKRRNCADIFFLMKTMAGYCCVFNYRALKDASDLPFLPPDPDLEYYDETSNDVDNSDGDETPPYSRIITTSESGRGTGLSVVFNVEPDDYPSWSLVPYYGVKVIIFDPNDYPERTIVYRYITLEESVDCKVEPMVFQCQSDVRRVSPEKRACWFHDEVFLGHTDRYSYETCYAECKMKNYMRFCNCVPFKYPKDPSARTCEFDDLKCLNNLTVHISEKEMYCDPPCYIECRDKKYSMTSDVTPFFIYNYPPEITLDKNISNLAALHVHFRKSNCNCYKLVLVIDLISFIATYGGVLSITFGGSLITVIEMSYILIYFIVVVIIRAISKFNSRNKIIVGK